LGDSFDIGWFGRGKNQLRLLKNFHDSCKVRAQQKSVFPANCSHSNFDTAAVLAIDQTGPTSIAGVIEFGNVTWLCGYQWNTAAIAGPLKVMLSIFLPDFMS